MMRDFSARSRDAYNKKADGYDASREGEFTAEFQKLLLSVMEIGMATAYWTSPVAAARF